MTTSNLLLKYVALIGGGLLLGYTVWAGVLTAQTSQQDEGSDSITTSPPSENSPANGGIDYEHAKPMPMPSLPDPAPRKTLPQPPSTGASSDHPESTEGSIGTGIESPQILVPPKSSSETNPANKTDSAEKK